MAKIFDLETQFIGKEISEKTQQQIKFKLYTLR
jgi:hypothetical protein